jgi:hypothetical protein
MTAAARNSTISTRERRIRPTVRMARSTAIVQK